MKFHHIGIAVNCIEITKKYYEDIGYHSSSIIFDNKQHVNLCFLNKKDSPTIELVAPVDEKSPVVNILKKNGVTPYHTCYEVDNIELEIKKLKEQGYVMISKPKPAIAFNNRFICFLYNKNIGLIELLNK
jgi:methylmalonyl-CoA/ethylmalonyl-CoA epimerase